jgi:hypothetical protein
MMVAGAAKVERQVRERQKCMMNHLAGSLAETEHSPIGQIPTISQRESAKRFLNERYGVTAIRDDSEQDS